jgi:uncharacterized membrane protein YeaQ/YmgE (transglycosylase-associated protein family)
MQLLFWMIDGLFVGWAIANLLQKTRRNPTMYLMGLAGAVAGGFLVTVSPFFVFGKIIFANLGALLGAAFLALLSQYLGGDREHDLARRGLPHFQRPISRRVAGIATSRQAMPNARSGERSR